MGVLKLSGWKMPGWKGVVLRLLVIYPGMIYVVLLLMITFMKESLVYPGVSMYQHLRLGQPPFSSAVEDLGLKLWQTDQGRYLGLKRTVAAPKMRWVVFHGNGDVALRASGWFDVIQRYLGQLPVDFYVLEYPGYGPQAGKTSEQSIVDLARIASETIPNDGLPLYFFGQSMGAGVSCRLITESEWNARVSGLFLLNPYTSLVDAAHQYLKRLVGPFYRLFPVTKIIDDRYESVKNIKAFEGSVVIIAGELDTLTPAWMAEALHEQVPGPCKLWIQQGVGHWTTPEPAEKWQELIRFITHSDME